MIRILNEITKKNITQLPFVSTNIADNNSYVAGLLTENTYNIFDTDVITLNKYYLMQYNAEENTPYGTTLFATLPSVDISVELYTLFKISLNNGYYLIGSGIVADAGDGYAAVRTYISVCDILDIDYSNNSEHNTILSSTTKLFPYGTIDQSNICPIVFGLDGYTYIGLIGGVKNSWGNYLPTQGNAIRLEELNDVFGIPSSGDDVNGNYSTEEGYNGQFDDHSDIIGIPDDPPISICNMGFIKAYVISPNALNNLQDELFPEIEFPEFDSYDLIENITKLGQTIYGGIQSMQNSNLMSYLLDAHTLPVKPSTSGLQSIKVGYKNTTCMGELIDSDYITFDCGTIKVSEFYGNFIDYTITAKLFLPFVGYVPIQPEYYMNGELNVQYKFNIIDGSFTCYVLSTSSKSKLTSTVIGTYSGNCCAHVPFSANNYSNVVSGLVGGIANGVQAVHRGSITGALSSATEIMSAKPSIMQGNGYNATSSILSVRVPYIIIEHIVASYSEKYKDEHGYPLNVAKKLKDCKGYTVCENPIIDELDCTDTEKDAIIDLLTSGIIL